MQQPLKNLGCFPVRRNCVIRSHVRGRQKASRTGSRAPSVHMSETANSKADGGEMATKSTDRTDEAPPQSKGVVGAPENSPGHQASSGVSQVRCSGSGRMIRCPRCRHECWGAWVRSDGAAEPKVLQRNMVTGWGTCCACVGSFGAELLRRVTHQVIALLSHVCWRSARCRPRSPRFSITSTHGERRAAGCGEPSHGLLMLSSVNG